MAELRRFAEKTGLPVEQYGGPGGGLVVRLVSPEGYEIEVLAGGAKAEPITTLVSIPANYANERASDYAGNARTGYVKRVNIAAGGAHGAFPEGVYPFHTSDGKAHVPENNTPRTSHVMRLGHVVLGCKQFKGHSEMWWKQHFGPCVCPRCVASRRQ